MNSQQVLDAIEFDPWETNAIVTRMRAHGFTIEGTGGNCDCFSRTLPDGRYQMITDGDAGAPIELSDSASLVTYPDAETIYPEYAIIREGPTCADVLAAFDAVCVAP